MIKNNRNNEQIYGRNDMIMLDPNNKIYGSLGLADRYVMKTEEGTKLTLSNPKLGSFDDVLTEFNIYGMSKQESTTGANLIDIDNMLNECLVKNADDTYSILKTETNRFSKSFPINLKAGTVVRFDADVIEYNGTYNNKLQCNFGSDTISEGHTITLREDITKVTIYQDGNNDVGTYTKFKNAILSVGKAKVPYEPYTGGKPSPSPDYPQEIKSVVNPTVKVTNEEGVEMIFKNSKLFELKRVKDVQEQSLKAEHDDYMIGLYNGLELAVAIMENRKPVYLFCVKEPEQIENVEKQEAGRTCYNGIIVRKKS